MSSWFTELTDQVKGVTEMAVKVMEENVSNETLQKLTLTTPELREERALMEAEETRKAAVKDMLASMEIWDTKDDDRKILVEECKEAILKLSQQDETFFGPFAMPPSKVVTSEEVDLTGDDEQEEEGDEEEDDEEDEDEIPIPKDRDPTEEQLEKLKKLSPLPELLMNFDLDAHVGLIQKLLEDDPVLVERQSTLSGGGERELIFWKNFFFNCAFTRFECGLSVDEIWSDQQQQAQEQQQQQQQQQQEDSVAAEVAASTAAVTAAVSPTSAAVETADTEETVVFHEEREVAPVAPAPATLAEAFASSVKSSAAAAGDDGNADGNGGSASTSTTPSSYEFVSAPPTGAAAAAPLGGEDPELDELEAEIMKELED